MSYEETIQKALSVEWKVGTCSQGDECWCRIITCKSPLFYEEDEFHVISAGGVTKEVVEHIVKLHNKSINNV